jgi:glutaredoxin
MSVVIYSKNNCPACDRAKALLMRYEIAYEIRNIDTDMEAMDFIAAQGHRSVPQIYRDGVHVPDPTTLYS